MAPPAIVAFAYLFVSACHAVDVPHDDTVCAMQMAIRSGEIVRTEAVPQDPCHDQLKMPATRGVVTNNLGGLGPDETGPHVIHISPFLELADGMSVDLTIANLSEYSSNSPRINGPKGEFNNINIAAGFVQLLFTFTDTDTGAGVTMPPFNLTVYDIDGPAQDVYAESASFASSDILGYKLTDTTDVTVNLDPEQDRIAFGSSALGEGCDNPSSVETLGVVECNRSGTVDQKDRSVAVTMKGGLSSYHITLHASASVRVGRNFLFSAPTYFDQVCKAPTPSPTSAPTATKAPSASPTMLPTGSPSGSPTGTPTFAPTGFPSGSPTYAPTGATSFGDPHVSNLEGQRFELLQPDYHTFLMIPRGSEAQRSLLQVQAKVEPFGPLCNGLLYVTGLVFRGQWLGDVLSLELSTRVDADMEAQKAIKMKVGNSSDLDVSQFIASVPGDLAEVTVSHPRKPEFLNQHVTTLQVKLKLGPCVSKVWMVYQKEKGAFTNSFWLTTAGLAHVTEEIGGILGHDDHEYAASRPEECSDSASLRDTRRTGINALALLGDDDEES